MPTVQTRNLRLNYQLEGVSSAPVLLFSNSLGTNLKMWDGQASYFKRNFCVLRYDARGQGLSSVLAGNYSISEMAEDAIALIDALSIAKVCFCGLSMGGMVGMALALKYPQRVEKVVMCNTAPKIGTPETWNARVEAVRRGGMAAIVDSVLERWFTPGFRTSDSPEIQKTRQMLLEAPPNGYMSCCAAVSDADFRADLAAIRVPTLVLSGASDPVTPPADGQQIAKQISGAHYLELPAAHLSNVEAADQFNAEVKRFLAG